MSSDIMSLDPVDHAVISQALIAAAREMGVELVRSAYSPIVREANDCSAALLDPQGRVVSQAELIPMQLGPIGTTFRPCAELFPPETLEEGDFYINNDPYHGGQHVPDVFLFSPIFLQESCWVSARRLPITSIWAVAPPVSIRRPPIFIKRASFFPRANTTRPGIGMVVRWNDSSGLTSGCRIRRLATLMPSLPPMRLAPDG